MTERGSPELRKVLGVLAIAGRQDRTVTIPTLQDELGLDIEELEGLLETLRENGQAVEVAPSEWRTPLADEVDLPATDRVRVRVPDELDLADEELRRLDNRGAIVAAEASDEGFTLVRLTMGVADALDADALGAIVKAGIEEARGRQEPFVLEVGP